MEADSNSLPDADHKPLELGWSVLTNETRAARKILRIYGCPPRIKEEAVSAWIYRIAARYRWSPYAVCKLLGVKFKPQALDFALTKNDMRRIADMTMAPAPSLVSPMSRGISELTPKHRRALVVRPDGSPRYRFCAQCLHEDEVPYWRLSWRLATTVLCERHDLLLTQYCPSCNESVSLNGRKYVDVPAELRSSVLRYCPMCRQPLDRAVPQPVPYRLVQTLKYFQQLVNEAMSHGAAHHPVYSLLSRDEFLEVFFKRKRLEPVVIPYHPASYPRTVSEQSHDSVRRHLLVDWGAIVHPRDIEVFRSMLDKPSKNSGKAVRGLG